MNQKIQEILDFPIKRKSEELYINPVTGILFVLKSSKIHIFTNIKFANQIPPDKILDFPASITSIDFNKNFVYIGLKNGELTQIDNVAFSISPIKKQIKTQIDLLSSSPSEDYLATYLKQEKKLAIIDLVKEKTKFMKLKYEISAIVWLTTTKLITASTDGVFHFWNIEKRKEYQQKKAHSSQITALSNHPRSSYTILSGDKEGILKIWDFDEKKLEPDLVKEFPSKTPIQAIANSSLGDISYCLDTNGIIRLLDMRYKRKEKQIIFINTGDSLTKFIPSNVNGSFLTISNTGLIKNYSGFGIDEINRTFTEYQGDIDAFLKKLESIPSWIMDNSLDVILPNEIPLLEKKLELVEKSIIPPLAEKIAVGWARDNFREYFKEIIDIENQVFNNIAQIKKKIENTNKELDVRSEYLTKIQTDVIAYLEKVSSGTKVSIEQLTTYFNTEKKEMLAILTSIEGQKDLKIKGVLKREYVGTFFEIISNDSFKSVKISDFDEILSQTSTINCYNCGALIDIKTKVCSKCNHTNVTCTSCLKYIQYNDIQVKCPHCANKYHFSCFESKIKLFGRCPHCRELVDFETLKNKTVKQKKEQDHVSDSLSRLVSIRSKFAKKTEEEKEDDELFDF